MNEQLPIRLFQKQEVAWNNLHDDRTTEIVYGGGAGGGKSLLGSLWLATEIANKPGSTWGIGRSELKKIKLSTLLTFKNILRQVGFSDDSYKYDDQKSVMTFTNGCLVVLMDLNENPSDPNYDRLGSTEFSGFFIDEAQEISNQAKQVVTSRLRHLTGKTFYITNSKQEAEEWIDTHNKGVLHYNEALKEYQVVMWKLPLPKLLMTCNPGRNFIYTDFYKPRRDNKLLPYRTFIQSLPTDNIFLDKAYIENLKNLDKVSRERLLYGNFDYSDDPGLLFSIDDISACFREKKDKDDTQYLTVDAARQGRDSTVIVLWEGLHIYKVEIIKKASLTNQAERIGELMEKYRIPISNVIVDEIGVGGGLVDILGCRGFIANAAAIQPYAAKLLTYKKRNYANLKTQAFFYLQKYLPQVTIYKDCEYKDVIIEEALFIRQVDIDNDSKIKLESKKDLKDRLGRSPDYIDTISFRMWWLIKDHSLGEVPEEDKDEQSEKDEFLEWLLEEDDKEPEDLDLDVY